MPEIDRLIELLFDQGGDGLSLAPDRPVVMTVGGQERTLTVREPDVNALLGEMAPPDRPDVALPGRHEFRYAAPAGTVDVRVYRTESSLRFWVVPAPEGGARPPAPENGAGRGDGASPDGALRARSADGNGTGPARERAVGDPARRVTVAAPTDGPAIDRLLRILVDRNGSDLHVSAERVPQIRKDGGMLPLEDEPVLPAAETEGMLLEIASERNRREFEERNDTDFAHEIPGVARFRVNLFRDLNGVGGVFRVIPSDIMTADDLGLPDQILDLCGLSKGLVLVTGPTGSGKSTTLAAMIDYINQRRTDHIITIEDPVEFVHPNKKCLINQREVGVHTNGFKVALRAALREDPDIVLVGEMRDLETVHIALETAETGHLVFGTLHTNTAPSTVDRVIDQFPSHQQGQIRTMLAESLKAVIAQTLCRKKGGGRVAAMEILLVTPAVSNLIREGKTFQIPSVMQTGRGQGMVTMNDALLGLVQEGLVEPEEAYRRAVARAEFAQLCQRNGVKLEVAG